MINAELEKTSKEMSPPSSKKKKNIVLETKNLIVSYSGKAAVKGVDCYIKEKEVTAIIGPSGCGKSTLLRVFNRMNDFIPGVTVEGKALYRGHNIYDKKTDPAEVRRRIGMVFQKPNPFPKSIYKNICWGPKINGHKENWDELVEKSLSRAGLWDEVKDRLHSSAIGLSGGQQQRLCIARAIAMESDVILMDEPCSALDPRSTARVEELITQLTSDYSIIIVTHNMQQASRVSKETAFMCEGRLVEFGLTKKIFTNPSVQETEDYITGRFG
jgi:phosphate transport system ATP-binding protein